MAGHFPCSPQMVPPNSTFLILIPTPPLSQFSITGFLLVYVLLVLFERQSDIQRDRERRRSLSAGSFAKCSHQPGLGQVKARARNSILVPDVGGRDTSPWAIFRCLPGCVLVGSSIRRWRWDSNKGTVIWDAGVPNRSLTRCTTRPAPHTGF